MSAPAMEKYQPHEFKPGIEFASDDELAREAVNRQQQYFTLSEHVKWGLRPIATQWWMID